MRPPPGPVSNSTMLRTFLAVLLISASAFAEDHKVEAIRATADAPAADAAAMPASAPKMPAASSPEAPARGAMPYEARKEDSSRMFHVGAMLGLLSLPRPLDVEIYARVTDFFFVGVSYSDFPAFVADPLLSAAGVKDGTTTARLDQFSGWDADLRVFPFAGSFFVGSSFGRQSLKGTITEQTTLGPQSAVIDLATIYATPRLGYLWTFGPGVVLGLDVGVQLKLSADRNVTMPPGSTQSMQDNANSLVDLGSSYPLPSFHLRFGWQY